MTKPALTWKELKEFAVKCGAKINDNEPLCECVCFGALEFYEEGFISWYGELICPPRNYDQMKTIIQTMFKN